MKLTAGEYLEIVIQKKHLSQAEIVRRVNNSGLAHIQPQNLNNIIRGHNPLGTERARVLEIVLKLPSGTLTSVATNGLTKGSKEIIKRVDEKAKELGLI